MTTSKRKDVWKFLADHAKVQPSGKIFVSFITDGESDFWQRVQARTMGYTSSDHTDLTRKQQQVIKDQQKLVKDLKIFKSIQDRHSEKMSKIVRKIDQGSNYYKKLILWLYRKTRDYLFNK